MKFKYGFDFSVWPSFPLMARLLPSLFRARFHFDYQSFGVWEWFVEKSHRFDELHFYSHQRNDANSRKEFGSHPLTFQTSQIVEGNRNVFTAVLYDTMITAYTKYCISSGVSLSFFSNFVFGLLGFVGGFCFFFDWGVLLLTGVLDMKNKYVYYVQIVPTELISSMGSRSKAFQVFFSRNALAFPSLADGFDVSTFSKNSDLSCISYWKEFSFWIRIDFRSFGKTTLVCFGVLWSLVGTMDGGRCSMLLEVKNLLGPRLATS